MRRNCPEDKWTREISESDYLWLTKQAEQNTMLKKYNSYLEGKIGAKDFEDFIRKINSGEIEVGVYK